METCTLRPVRKQPVGQVMVHLVPLGENALGNRHRQHGVEQNRVQESVRLRAVDHAGAFPRPPARMAWLGWNR
jgi:hypothetical protein